MIGWMGSCMVWYRVFMEWNRAPSLSVWCIQILGESFEGLGVVIVEVVEWIWMAHDVNAIEDMGSRFMGTGAGRARQCGRVYDKVTAIRLEISVVGWQYARWIGRMVMVPVHHCITMTPCEVVR